MKKLCPKCLVELDLVICDDVFNDEYLICPKCYGTFNIEDSKSYLVVLRDSDVK
jgi:Zn-finger nucleic acid-binding protein